MCRGLLPSLARSFAFAPLFDVRPFCNKQKTLKNPRPMGPHMVLRSNKLPSTATSPCTSLRPCTLLYSTRRPAEIKKRCYTSARYLLVLVFLNSCSSMQHTPHHAPHFALRPSAAPAACSTCYLPRYCCWWWWWWWWWWCYCDGCCSWRRARRGASAFMSTVTVRTSPPLILTRPGLAPAGLETLRQRVRDTFTRRLPAALE